MIKKSIIVSLFTLLLIAAVSGVAFAATEDNNNIAVNGSTKVADSWGWKSVGYDKDALTGSGKCDLKAADNVHVICEPAGTSDNKWTIVSTDFPDNVEKITFNLYYYIECSDIKGKPSTAYVTTVTVTGNGVFNLNEYAYAEHTGYIKHVALGPAEITTKKTPKPIFKIINIPIKKPIFEEIWEPILVEIMKPVYKPVMKPIFEPIYAPIFEPIYKVIKQPIYGTKEIPIEEKYLDPIFAKAEDSVTATNDAKKPLIVQNSNHFTYAKLDREALEEGVTLDMVVGNGCDFVTTVFVQLVNGKLEITFPNANVAEFGAVAFNKIPTADNGNIHSLDEFKHNNQAVINCPAGDTIYLYIHANGVKAIKGYVEKTKIIGYETVTDYDNIIGYNEIITKKIIGFEYKGLSDIIIGYTFIGFSDEVWFYTCEIIGYEGTGEYEQIGERFVGYNYNNIIGWEIVGWKTIKKFVGIEWV